MSMPTLTLIATPDPPERPETHTPAQLRDLLTLARQEYGELLAAARATLAADALNMSNPLGYLRDHLALLGALPPAGARPHDYQVSSPDEGVWGRR
jgi:hypothetical protein